MSFFKSYPEKTEEVYCYTCYHHTTQVVGIGVSGSGFWPATQCVKCKQTNHEDRDNPFDELNSKLDRLLRHLGLSCYE